VINFNFEKMLRPQFMEKEFVTFNYFSHYAQFILDNHLDAFVNADIDRLYKLNVPLLKLT
jgi:hypothetical protein